MGLLTNTQDKAFRGAQFAWLVNQARERAGTQISAIGNLSLKAIKGWQVSGGVNWAMGPIQGSQVVEYYAASARLAVRRLDEYRR